MDNYQVATVVLAILAGVWGIVAGTGRVIAPLIRQLAEVNGTMAGLAEKLRDLTDRNSRSHSRIIDRLEEQGETISDHETRIRVMERQGS